MAMAGRSGGSVGRRARVMALGAPLALLAAVVAGGPVSAKPASGGGTPSTTTSTTTATATDKAGAITVSAPPSGCGATGSVTASVMNNGTTTWTAGTYQLVAATGSSGFAPSAVTLGGDVMPGGVARFAWTATAPSSSGTFSFSWVMSNGTATFGQPSTSQAVTQSCPIGDLYAGKSQFVADSSFSIPAETFQNGGTPGHSDTATLDRGAAYTVDRYYLYYRTFKNASGTVSPYGTPTGIALAIGDGTTFTPYNSGQPVLATRPSASTAGCTPDATSCVIAAYAPSVVQEPNGTFTMAYEVMDTSVPGNAPTPRNWIEMATSPDGKTWTTLASGGSTKVLAATTSWEGFNSSTGQNVGNVGTPDLHGNATSGYTLGYHGFSGSAFARGYATGTQPFGLTRAASNPQFQAAAGWMGTGPGKAADTAEGSFTYRVFEAFNGGSGCVLNTNEVGWGLARSADGGASWQYSSLNPIRTDRTGYSCGEDMPSWQIINGAPYVLATRINGVPAGTANVRRYAIATPKQALTSGAKVVGVATTPAGDGYWELDASGGTYAFGAAGGFAQVPAGGSSFTALAASPAGTGLWLLTSSGQVVATSGLSAYGGPTVHGGVRAVGISADSAGTGYWVLLSNGSVQAFGSPAPAVGPGGSTITNGAVAITRAPSGDGFWVLSSSGAIASYNGAPALTVPAMTAAAVGFSASADGTGGWVVDANGKAYPVGTATPIGDTSSSGHNNGYQPFAHFGIVGISPRSIGSGGYYLLATDGGIIDFGTAPYLGHVRGSGSNS